MAFSFRSSTFSAKTSTGSQAITGVGFQPKLIFFFAQNRTTDGNDAGSGKYGIWGAAVSSSSRFATCYADDATRYTNAKCITFISGGGTILNEADLTSFDSDGFTLNWSTASATGPKIGFVAFGGADLTNVAIEQIQSPTATGTQDYTGAGFQPDAIFTSTSGFATAPPSTQTTHGFCSIGFGTDSSNESALAIANIDTSGPDTDFGRYQRTDKVLTQVNKRPADGLMLEAEISTILSTGVRLNWTTVSASAIYCWIVYMKGGSYKVKNITQKTSTGTQATTGVGFLPDGVIFASFMNVATTSIQNRAMSSVGAYDGTNNFIVGCDMGTALGVRLSQTKCYQTTSGGGVTVVSEANGQSLDADGWTLNYTTADGTAREILGWVFGDTPGGAETVTPDKWFGQVHMPQRDQVEILAY